MLVTPSTLLGSQSVFSPFISNFSDLCDVFPIFLWSSIPFPTEFVCSDMCCYFIASIIFFENFSTCSKNQKTFHWSVGLSSGSFCLCARLGCVPLMVLLLT